MGEVGGYYIVWFKIYIVEGLFYIFLKYFCNEVVVGDVMFSNLNEDNGKKVFFFVRGYWLFFILE